MTTLGDLPACVGVLKSLISNKEDLGEALNAGLATAVGAEILEGLKYVEGGDPYANESGIGFVPDPIIRSLGVPLVTGDIPGVAVVLGKADEALQRGRCGQGLPVQGHDDLPDWRLHRAGRRAGRQDGPGDARGAPGP